MVSQTPIEFAAHIWCRPENEQRQMDVELAQSIADAVAPVMEERDKLREALQWASAAGDFAPGGKARRGWLRQARPALNHSG